MSDDEQNNLVRIEWRLLQMMAEHGIRRNTQLAQLMREAGVDISTHQVGYLLQAFPTKLNTLYLRGLLTVLKCDIGDLIRVLPAKAQVIEGANSAHPVPKATKAPGRGGTRRPAREAAANDTPSPQKRMMPEGFEDLDD